MQATTNIEDTLEKYHSNIDIKKLITPLSLSTTRIFFFSPKNMASIFHVTNTICILIILFSNANSQNHDNNINNNNNENIVFITEILNSNSMNKQSTIKDIKNLTAINYKDEFYGYAGHYTVPAQHNPNYDNHIYTWYQPCSDCEDETKAPLLFWLQGGPGGPGWFGAFAELGNWYIGGNTSDAEPHKRCFSWCAKNNCLFIDQPVNTGFSFQTDRATGKAVTDVSKVDYTDTSKSAMSQALSVLLQFYKVFPELKSNKFIISGESYGGLYTGNFGYLIMKYNEKLPVDQQINFKALAVGDPCINWKTQMLTYPNTLYGMGVLMLDERADLLARMQESVKYLDESCPKAFNIWNQVWDDNGGLGPSQGRGWFARTTGSFNTENILMGNSPTGWQFMGIFWQKQEAAEAFHVASVPKPSSAEQNALNIYDAFVNSSDWCANSSWTYAELIANSEIDLMIYSSTADPLLGPPTTEAGVFSILSELVVRAPKTGPTIKKTFETTKKDVWFVDSKHDEDPAGYAKCVSTGTDRRFCYTVVRNAGHEMPGYQPRASYDMLDRFLEKREWSTIGDRPVPTCSECSGVGPFAGEALPSCHGGDDE